MSDQCDNLRAELAAERARAEAAEQQAAALQDRGMAVIEAYQAYADHLVIAWQPQSGQEKRRALELWDAVTATTRALAASGGAAPAERAGGA